MATQDNVGGNLAWKRYKDLLLGVNVNVDRIFYRIGFSIGSNPWLWLLASACLSCICGPGLLLWKEEIDEVKLFIPTNSIVRADAFWARTHFHEDLRYESVLITAPNVLEPEVIRKIHEIEEAVKNTITGNHTWRDVCAGYLTWFEHENHKTTLQELEDIQEFLDALNDTLATDACIYRSILQLWDRDGTNVETLSREDILRDVTRALNTTSRGASLSDIGPLLSRVTRDRSGRVTGASATLLHYILRQSEAESANWELEFIREVLFSNRTLPPGMEIYAVASRSFYDFLYEILDSNYALLFSGFLLIIVYVLAMVGRCNRLHQRVYLSLAGVSVVGLTILSAYGICFYFGFIYGPLHPILPFLLLGVAIDDMFVVMQSLEKLTPEERRDAIPLRVARSLQHSGTSITVTSLSSVAAFGIGMTTVMPFLQSFCFFASTGIFFLYVYEIIFFVSCLVLDERRLGRLREGCCCRKLSPDWRPNACSQRSLQRVLFEDHLGKLLMRREAKLVVLLLTGLMLAVNVWGATQVEQYFDPLWYLNQKSYPIRFNEKLKEFYPRFGHRASIYMSGVDFYRDYDALHGLVGRLRGNAYVNNRTLDPWFVAYHEWLDRSRKGSYIENREEYYNTLTEYLLFTKEGRSYIKDIKFDRLPFHNYTITASKIEIQHIMINTTADQVKAMQSLREAVGAVNLSRADAHFAIHSDDYVSWTANKIIGEELVRNLILEIVAVCIVTVLFLRDLRTSFWVLCCVLFTLVDLLGSMYFAGLTIEISSSILTLLCAGLAVDYAAHIGLEFAKVTGTKNERAITTLGLIGPAVFNGGFSTFLAFVLLCTSDSYMLNTFFKLFTSVVFFGLFHGLIFLPVVLSLFGPDEKKVERVEEVKGSRERNGFCAVTVSKIECPALQEIHPIGEKNVEKLFNSISTEEEQK